MKKFEADSLEKAYEMATLEFGCSITELSIEVFQQPSNGFLGFLPLQVFQFSAFQLSIRLFSYATPPYAVALCR